jgi:ABC-type branched-subunit amino acid transport system ATPase component
MALCERITVLAHGSVIASGTPDEVSRDQAVIDAYLGGALHGSRAV